MKPPRSVWVVSDGEEPFLAPRAHATAWRHRGFRVHRYDLHRPKRKARKGERSKR